MNNIELKHAIANDLETLKHIELEIIPAQTYYLDLLKLFLGGLWKMSLIIFLTVLYSGSSNPSNSGIASEPWVTLIIESAVIGFFMAIGAMLVLSIALVNYYLIKYHLEHRLKTGPLLVDKLRQFGWIFYLIFCLLCWMFGSYTESAAIFVVIVFSFFISGFVTQCLIGMEMKRVGISTLFTVVNEFFAKSKNA